MPRTTDKRPGGTFRLGERSVARIGYGAMQLAARSGRSRGGAVAVLRRAVELGVNHIDTAQFYGLANELIHEALHPYPGDLVLVTKVGAEEGEQTGLTAAQRPEQLRAGVEANLRALDVECMDMVYLRRMDTGPGILAQGHQIVDLDSQLAELVALRDEGKLGAIGLSNVTADQILHALPTGIAGVQNAYSLLDRSSEPLLDLCRRHDLAWVPFFPLGSAFPGMPKVTDQPVVISAAGALGATASQVGLAWLLSHAPNILLIPGTSNVTHLSENVATADVRLDPTTIDVLDGIATASC